MTGKIKAIKRDKGFGFIRDSEGIDRFFHINGLEGVTLEALNEGDAVEFEPYAEEGKGVRARRVRRAA